MSNDKPLGACTVQDFLPEEYQADSMVVDVVITVKYLKQDGNLALANRISGGMSPWEAVGIIKQHSNDLEDAMRIPVWDCDCDDDGGDECSV